MILVLLVVLASMIMKLICDVRFLLLVNEELVKYIRWRELVLSGMKCSSWEVLLCCYFKCLLSALILSFVGFIACAAYDKLNDALG